jgi:hypothetical protein
VTRPSSWLSGDDVAGAWDDFWSCYCLALLRLVANQSHMGANVDELAYRPYRPMNYG